LAQALTVQILISPRSAGAPASAMAPKLVRALVASVLASQLCRCDALSAEQGACAAEACGPGDEVGLLQRSVDKGAVTQQISAHDAGKAEAKTTTLIDLRQAFAKTEATCSGVSLALSNVVPGKGVELEYTVDPSGSCSGTNAYGPAKCCEKWGTNATVGFKGTAPAGALSSLGQLAAKLTLYSSVWGNYFEISSTSATCAPCAANCTIPPMSILGINIDLGTIELPACPGPDSTSFDMSGVVVALPETNPLGASGYRAVFDATVTTAAGALLMKATMKAEV